MPEIRASILTKDSYVGYSIDAYLLFEGRRRDGGRVVVPCGMEEGRYAWLRWDCEWVVSFYLSVIRGDGLDAGYIKLHR